MKKILIIEDDPQIAKILSLNFKYAGFSAQFASTFQEGMAEIKRDEYDLVLLDIGLPDGDGLDLCQKLRDSGDDIPVLFISARSDEATVVKAISQGADDYLRKPFGIEELKARMNKILKKFSPSLSLIQFGELTIDPANRMMKTMDRVVSLGSKELGIMLLLAKRAGEIVSRENILEALYQNVDLYDRTVDSHMSHLRKKLRELADNKLQINSVYGLGYRLVWTI